MTESETMLKDQLPEATDVPTVKFSGLARRLDPGEATPLHKQFFDCFFPEFHRLNRARRFSGDLMSFLGPREADLPRNRYFALCGPDRTDGGLLRNELSAYGNALGDRRLLLVDPLVEAEASFFNLTTRDKGLLCVLSDVARSRFAEYLTEIGERKAGALTPLTGDVLTLLLPTASTNMTVVGCVDLRRAEARRWFFDRYRNGVPGQPGHCIDAGAVELTSRTGLRNEGFQQMLRALTVKTIGGGLATQVIGADLRRLGVAALIFPSARSDFYSSIENGRLTDWYGWNLVDYRGAPPPIDLPTNGMWMMSEGDRQIDGLRKINESLMTIGGMKGGYESAEAAVRDLFGTGKSPRLAEGGLPSIVAWNIDDFWTPPDEREIWVGCPANGPREGSLAVRGLEMSFRERILQFSEHR